MTTTLFPGSAQETRPDPLPDDPAGPLGRWSLHRAGIVNVWQYDRAELRFAGGRMLLRGKNGAGKSKALEVLLPFLLDGDTRQLDATGRDRTTVGWLMTDGRPAGNHVGYVWLELRCLGDSGEPSHMTLGAGLKASTATRKADCWFFITDRRVGVDLDLDVAGECLSIERLKVAIGEENVTASGAEHRRRVGRHVFGMFDEARYRNLLHLLHRLRDPNIGNRVEAGALAEVLTDALPPIDDRVLSDAAGHFDDLDTIRDQVDRATRTAQALGQFLGTYRCYTRTVLSRRAAAVEAAEATRSRASRHTRQLTRAVDEATAAVDDAQTALDAERATRTQLEAERRELERSDGYRAHQDLVDRQARVDALDVAARASETAAELAVAARRRAGDQVASSLDDLRRSLTSHHEAAVATTAAAAEAGLDPALLGPPLPPLDDGDVDPQAIAAAEAAARSARTLVEVRTLRAGEVRDLAVQAEQAERDAAAAEERAASSEADVEAQAASVAAAGDGCLTAEAEWADSVTAWTASEFAATLDVSWDAVLNRLAGRVGEPTWVAAVRQGVADAVAPAVRDARRAAAEAELALVAAQEAVVATESRLAELEAETEARPAPSPFRGVDRDPAAGTPLYELVDVAPHVDGATAAGLEAALEASGLLDAWVGVDGLVIHPDTNDVIVDAATTRRPSGEATLADVLVPAAVDGGPVGRERVAAVLASIALGEQPGSGRCPDGASPAWVTASGRWGLGVLRGAWGKETVEFLGASARRATRVRRIAELRAELAARLADRAAAADRSTAAAERRELADGLLDTLPASDAIDAAERELKAAERSLAGARARFETDRLAAEQARAAANRQAAAVAHEAALDALPTGVADLDRVLASVAEVRQHLHTHERSLHDVRRDCGRVAAGRSDEAERRGEAESAAAAASTRRADHATARHELDTLRTALASTVDVVLARHGEVTARLTELDETIIPSCERARRDADSRSATATAELAAARAVEDQAGVALVAAGDCLAAAVVLPGIMLAATGQAVTQLADVVPYDPDASALQAHVALAAAVAPLVDGDDEVSDGAILSRYDRLSDSLAGGYDTAIDEIDGVKVVHVADDTDRQPLAAVAARLDGEAQAAQGRLVAREREVLERFLLRELADEVRSKLLDAHDLVRGTNRMLAGVRTSHGKGAHLEWKLGDEASAPASVAERLLVDDLRDETADAELRDALLAMIDAERAADPSAGYEQHLRAALDYRAWHRFTVKVTDAAHPGSERKLSSRLGLSQGEQRVVSYLALFAAAAAHFEAIARETPTVPRLLLLDDAFAKVDEPTHGELLGLLVDLGLDFVLTSERMWGCFPSVPSLDIYEAVRDPTMAGVAIVHFRWDGQQRHLVGV